MEPDQSSPALGRTSSHYAIDAPAGTSYAEDVDLDPARTRIEAERYVSPEFATIEEHRLWPSVWQLACRSDEVAGDGDYVRYVLGRQQYLVVRQADGTVRAFENVCLHRGTQLRVEDGRAASFRCPFHGWTWNIDGTLRTVPDRHLFVGFDDDQYALPEARCEEWAGFVFLNPDPGAAPLEGFLGAVTEHLAPYRFGDQVTSAHVTQPLSANWKTVIEAFLESYHTLGIHPQLLSQLDDVDTTYELLGDHSRMIVPFGVPSPRLSAVTVERMVEVYTDTGGAVLGSKLLPDLPPLRVGHPDHDGDADPDLPTMRDHVIEVVAERAAALGHDLSGLSRDQHIDDWHYFVFPNVVLNINPLSTLLLRARPMVGDPDRCWIDVITLAVPNPGAGVEESRPRLTVGEGELSYGLVLNQDFENLPRVQAGIHTRGFRHLTLSKQEVRIVAFQETLDRYLGLTSRASEERP